MCAIVFAGCMLLNQLTFALSTQGNQIVTNDGTPVRIMGVSWFGFESTTLVPHGLWTRSYRSMMDQMKSLGFNTIRIPFCNQMFDHGSKPMVSTNMKTLTLQACQALKYWIKSSNTLRRSVYGLSWIIIEAMPAWVPLTMVYGIPMRIPSPRFIRDWQMLAKRYRNNPTVIRANLHNEPHYRRIVGNKGSATDWHAVPRKGRAMLFWR